MAAQLYLLVQHLDCEVQQWSSQQTRRPLAAQLACAILRVFLTIYALILGAAFLFDCNGLCSQDAQVAREFVLGSG